MDIRQLKLQRADEVFDDAVLRANARFQNEISTLKDAVARTDARLSVLQSEEPISLTREGVFCGGQAFDAFRAIQGIIETARKSLAIADNYVDETVLDMCAVKPNGVTLRPGS